MSAIITNHLAPKCLTTITGLSLQRAKRVEVVLGMSKHDCRFHGICRVEKYQEGGDASECGCHDAVPAWLLRPEPNYCVLMLWRGRLPKEREAYHFSRKRLELCNALNISGLYGTQDAGELHLRRGSYSIRRTKDYYVLYLPVETQYYTAVGHMR
jgi:hypothetical protein